MKFLTSFLAVLLSALLIPSPLPAQPMPADAPATSSIQLRLLNPGDSSFRVNSVSTSGLEVAVTDGAGNPVADAAVAFRLPDSGAGGTFPDGTHSIVRYTDVNGRAEAPTVRWNGTPGPFSIRITAAKGAGHAGLLVDQNLTQGALASAPASPNRPHIAEHAELTAVPSAADVDADEQPIAHSGAASADTPLPNAEPPSVSITSASPAGGPHIGKKWIILAAVAAAAGVGAMMAMRAAGGSSAAAASGLSVGSPSISVGHP
jgi:hypothetical protein